MAAGEGAAPRRFIVGGGGESCHAGLVISNRSPLLGYLPTLFVYWLGIYIGFDVDTVESRSLGIARVSNAMNIDEDRTKSITKLSRVCLIC